MVIYRYLELHSMSFLVLRGKHEARWKWRSRTKNTTREVYRKLAPKCVFGKWLVQPRLRLSRRKTPGWSSRCIHIYIITYHIIHVYIYMYQWACVCVCVWTYMFNMYRQTREGQWSEHTKSRYQYPSLGQLPWTRGTRCEPLSPLLPPTYLALCGTGSCLAQLQHAVAKETKIKMNKAAAPVGGHVGFPPPDL